MHALNILRALFRDTRLGEDVTPLIAEGIRAAVLAYGSKFWAIRNSATLLFSALVGVQYVMKWIINRFVYSLSKSEIIHRFLHYDTCFTNTS